MRNSKQDVKDLQMFVGKVRALLATQVANLGKGLNRLGGRPQVNPQ